MSKHSNLQFLMHIEVRKKRPAKDYLVHIPEKPKTWFSKYEPEQWKEIDHFLYTGISREALLERGFTIDEDNKVWLDPDVKMVFANSKEPPTVYRFKTDKEAELFRDKIIRICGANANFQELIKLI